ncbi:MAG: hypothetical protein CL609_18555 [Anaerolineaceae bacterium]|nr:hypothetical protein [Anaerolineaceae bacterium]
MKFFKLSLVFVFALLLIFNTTELYASYSLTESNISATQNDNPPVVIPAGNDYATDVLKDPWDMNEFHDIDKWLNNAGTTNELLNIQVSDGVFSAKTEGTYSEFYPLFPGYKPGLLHGKIGALYPIDSSQYQCLFLAEKIDKNAIYQIFYGSNRNFISGIDPYTSGFAQHLNAYASSSYRLYKVDLKNPPTTENLKWTDLPEWQVLKINPTWNANTNLSYDWIRLTDCNPVYFSISGLTPNTQYDFWVGLGSPERLVLIQSGVSSDGNGGLQIDTQGMEETEYTYYVKTAGTSNVVKSGQLIINKKPEVEFYHPSPTSGEDFATAAGAPWDMSGPEDVWDTRCSTYQFIDGILHVYTDPHQCAGGVGEAEPKIFLSFPNNQLAAPADYRYLNIRMYQNGPYSAPEEGMAGRWMWRSNGCTYVSREISLEIGWHTYTIDLYDPYNGVPVDSDYCSANTHWLNFTEPNANFRFDPNENVMDFHFHQQIDWIKLNKMESVKSGEVYTIEYNSSEEDLQSLVFYYTDNLDEPKKNQAQEFNLIPGSGDPVGPYFVYLPTLLKNYVNYEYPTYQWDTSGVNLGEYYICAVANDGYNESVSCSAAPVKIIP